MEKRRNAIDRAPPKQRREYPSFSSTLLDAIYRSIDETDKHSQPSDRIPSDNHNAIFFSQTTTIIPPLISPPVTHPRRTATSSSSDASSYGGFSSSDTESASTPHPARLRPIRTAPPVRSDRFRSEEPSRSGDDRKNGSIRSRLRDLRSGGRSPSSPGARLANFLGSIFAAKSKVSAETETETSSSFSRSCLSRTPATAKRTVRFCPVSVTVGEDRRTCVGNGDRRREAAAAVVAPPVPPARRWKVGEEEEEEDLFELKNLAVIGRFRDELPVYETTRVGKYSGVSRGLIM